MGSETTSAPSSEHPLNLAVDLAQVHLRNHHPGGLGAGLGYGRVREGHMMRRLSQPAFTPRSLACFTAYRPERATGP